MTGETGKSNQKVIAISLSVGFVLMLIKFLAFYFTDSKAILTDASESIVNVAAAAFALYSLKVAVRPKDRNHPYGHGKIEFFSSGFEGVLILVTGLVMILPAVESLIEPSEVENLTEGIWLIVITIIINGLLGFFLIRIGKQNDSIALKADGQHLLLDSGNSIILITGLFAVKWTGKGYIDGILALLLAGIIIYNGISLMRKSVSGLMDEMDEATFSKLINILNQTRSNSWIDVHNLRVQKYGADIHIDCHLTLPFYYSLEQAHEQVVKFERAIQSNYPFEVEVFVHSDPCIPQCCHYCLLTNCAVRKEAFVQKKEWTERRILSNTKHFVD